MSKYYIKFKEYFIVDKIIFICLMALAVINIFVQYSANDKNVSHLISDFAFIFLSFIIMFIVANINLNNLKQSSVPLYIFTLILLIAVLIIGVRVNGAKRWLELGFRMQPSELCKLTIPLLLAYYYNKLNESNIDISIDKFLLSLIFILVPFALIAKEPDLGTGLLILFAGCCTLLVARFPIKYFLYGLLSIILSLPLIWHSLHDYQKHRVLTLLHPESDPLGKGYHIIQGIIAIGSGGLTGKGYLKGTQSHLQFIPEKHTDFVITVIAEEFGFIGVLSLLVLYLILIMRILNIMHKATDDFSKILSGSIALSLAIQIFINMAMVSGMLPVVGVPLPMISYGGTALIIFMTGMGIVLAINKKL